jgi:hypothetical protein
MKHDAGDVHVMRHSVRACIVCQTIIRIFRVVTGLQIMLVMAAELDIEAPAQQRILPNCHHRYHANRKGNTGKYDDQSTPEMTVCEAVNTKLSAIS